MCPSYKLREKSMTIEVGENMTWHRVSNDRRRTDEIPVRTPKIAGNGVFVEVLLPDGVTPPDGVKRKARVARDCILPPLLSPAPYVRPTAPPPDPKPMLGEPAGRIPTVLPKPRDPMIVVGDAERTVHAVPSNNIALCRYSSATGWLWQRGCDELDRDMIVQALRRYDVPVTRENYIGFNWTPKPRPWTAEHEAELPTALQDLSRIKRKKRKALIAMVLEGTEHSKKE
jgi:hypothetical protein